MIEFLSSHYLEFIIIFVVTGFLGNLLADLFIVQLSDSTFPSYLSTNGLNAYSVGMSTSLCGLLFYTLVVFRDPERTEESGKLDVFILTFWLFIGVLPWLYSFIGGEPFNISGYVHIGGSLCGLALGLLALLAKKVIKTRSFSA
ncbi:rhomboid family intramembrane serine protease [Lacticaseibacillus paracasei]|uniref:rhomboid family intramembrane serine protease n=1 Tax=Lacticaseibacillus paracasei TaxID=1597 RepID=UPI00374E1AAE